MYRIEVATGEETVFRTVEELATGIRNGLITPRSRIWHGASQKWLPIEFHPHYKKALDLVTGGAPMIDTGLTRPPAPSTRRAAPNRTPAARAAEPPAPAPTPAPVPAPAPASPRPAMVEPPRPAVVEPSKPVAPRSQHAGFGPPRFGPPPFEAPRAGPPTYSAPSFEPGPAPGPVAVALPPIEVPSVEIQLPNITYPEVEPIHPESAHPVARRRAKGSAPLALGGLVIVALVGGYFATSSAARATDAEPVAVPAIESAAPSAPDEEAEILGQDVEPEPQSDPSPPPTTTPLPPARVVAAAAPAVKVLESAPRPTGPVSQAWSSSAGAIAPVSAAVPAPVPAPAADNPQLAPAPAQLQLALPKLPKADTIGAGGRAARDSAALNRILRAVGGRPSDKAAR
jgi:hypothetical protein